MRQGISSFWNKEDIMAIYQATADDRNALTLIFFIQKNYWKLIAQEILTKAPTYGKYFLTDHAKNNTPQQTLEKPYLKTQAFIFSRPIFFFARLTKRRAK